MKIALKYLVGVFLWLIAYIIIRNVHSSCIADYFILSNFTDESTHEYFKLICEITASVFAILLAVITFGFELLGNNSRRRKRFNFLTQWWVSFAISIPVVIILFSLHSAFSLQNLKETNDLTTAYFIGIMFVVFVLALFPFTVFLIRQTDTVDEVKNSIKQFTGNGDFDSVITDELIYYIQDFDRDAYNSHLMPSLNQQCLTLIGDASDRRKTNAIFHSLTKVWMAGNIDAVRVNEAQYFVSQWLAVKQIYFHAAMNKSFLLHYQEIEDFIRIQIEFLTIKNSIDGLSNAAIILSEIYQNQLQNNCPTQDTIDDLYLVNEDSDAPNGNQRSDMQWNHINDILWELHHLQRAAIELKSKHLFETVKNELLSIVSSLHYTQNSTIGNYQERFIIYEIFSWQIYHAKLALDSGLFLNTADAFYFKSFPIADYIRDQKIFAKDLLSEVEVYLLYCQKNNFLDDFSSVRDLGGLGRVISMEYANNTTVQNEFLSIVEILAKLKVEIEKQVNFSENLNHGKIKKELESLKGKMVAVPVNNVSQNTLRRINEILNTF